MAWIQMKDFWTFRPTEVQENKKHLFECKDSKSDTGSSLLVHVAASHSAIVNGNRRFYRPDKMQEGIHTWLPEKATDGTVLRTPCPVLVGHDEKGDVLGRVLEAQYVDESWKYANDFPIVKDFVFYQRDGRKRRNLFQSVDWVVDNLLPLKEYTGLGYTDLGLRITNPEAIRKVLADEYLTVSVGFKTDAAVCSLCHTDWATDGKCGHKLGEIEDGHQMFLIAGKIHNTELSFINFAADPFATTLSKKVLTDSLEKMFFLGLPIDVQNNAVSDGLQLTDGLVFEADLQAAEEPMNSVIDINSLDLNALETELKAPALTKERATEVKDSLKAWAPDSDELKSKKRSLVSTVNAKIRKNGWDKVTDGADTSDEAVADELKVLMDDGKKKVQPGPSGQSKGVSAKSAEAAKETQQKEIAGKSDDDKDDKDKKKGKKKDGTGDLEANDAECEACDWEGWEPETDEEREYFADTDGLYTEMEVELDGAVTDGLIDATTVKDAKLSTDKRKELSKDAFCGPNRSFPVPDCAHATAARRLVGRAKVSDGTKSKILACVSSKEKTLKCKVAEKKKDGVETTATDSAAADPRATKFIDSVLMTDAAEVKEISAEQRNKLVSILKALDEGYDSLAEAPGQDIKWVLRWAVRAMLDDWSADDSLAYALKALAAKDQVALSRSEVDEKDETINGLMSEKDALATELAAVKDSRNVLLASSKRTLAQQIVMHGVLKGQDGYKDLTPEQTTEKINTLAQRHIVSLRDSVSDLLSGLKFTDAKPAAVKPAEADHAVDDHTQITDAAPAGENNTDGALDEADQALSKFQKRLRLMSPRDQVRELARFQFESAHSAK